MKIGFIGLGIMGESMCENIIKKHNDKVFAFDVEKEKTKKLEALGAIGCDSALKLSKQCDIIITMVPNSENSMAVYKEILPALEKGKLCIDMSTIDPSVSMEIADMVKRTGAQFADAPVVKSKPAAIEGKLGIYLGCEKQVTDKVLPVLSYMGENIIRMGDNGMGLVMKICHNTLVSEIQNGVNETIFLARKHGISIDDFKTAVSFGGAQNFYLDTQAQRLRNNDWTTAFSLENMHKDLMICQKIAEEKSIDMPGMRTAKAVYDKAVQKGLGKEDFRSTLKVVTGEI